jgi:hypothetical protein
MAFFANLSAILGGRIWRRSWLRGVVLEVMAKGQLRNAAYS